MNEDLLFYSLYGATIVFIACLRFEVWKWWERGSRLTEDQVDSVLAPLNANGREIRVSTPDLPAAGNTRRHRLTVA